MKKEDFDEIERGDTIEIKKRYSDGIVRKSLCYFSSIFDDAVYLNNGFIDYVETELHLIESLSVLTGNLAPWSSPYVEDDSLWCVQSKIDGFTIFFGFGGVSQSTKTNSKYIVTRRPSC